MIRLVVRELLQKKILPIGSLLKRMKSCRAESNRRPPPYQGDALPTEPRQPVRVTYATILIYTKPSLIVNIYLKIYQKSNHYAWPMIHAMHSNYRLDVPSKSKE